MTMTLLRRTVWCVLLGLFCAALSACNTGASLVSTASTTANFTVGGAVTGLSGTLVVQNSGGDNLSISADGSFTFGTAVADGASYVVSVLTQPDGQTCAVANASGTLASANVTNVAITCASSASVVTHSVGGTVSGLTGTVVLQNNAGDDLTITADGVFTFGTALEDDVAYAVTIATQPAGQTCVVANGSGTASAEVTSVAVTCVTNDTTLSASVSALGLSVNNTGLNAALTGTPRLITITNTGASPATDVTYAPSPALPSGTTISPAGCGTIAASGTCVLTITPGATPSAAAGDTSPTPITLSVAGANTNTLTPTVHVVTYGSVYQGGYVFAVDDTTPDAGSIGGKVAALTDQSAGVLWSSNGSSAVSYVGILGINELSTTISPSPTSPAYSGGTPAYVACAGKSDGACNTANIVAYYNFNRAAGGAAPTPQVQYAAGVCATTIDDRSDWYLPAICEMGYDDIGSGANGCGIQASPTVQNMLSNLFDATLGGLSGEYWSATEWSGDAIQYAWSQTFDLGNIPQNTFDKSYNTIRVRCARALIP